MSFIVFDFIFPVKIQSDYSTIVVSSRNKIIHAFLSGDDKWRMLTELDEISPILEKAIIHKEDKYFYYHLGVNPLAVIRAVFNNTRSGRRTSGASTITMQVARLLEPKERTYFNKFIEMFRALQLEWHFSKKEILQMYLNLAPYGGNIEGVKAASLIYFNKTPEQLSIAEAAVLSIIPNRPGVFVLGKNNAIIKTERNKWLARYREDQLFDNQYINDALDEPLEAKRNETPKLAPHFALRMKNNICKPIIKTSLDLKLQRKVEQLVKNHVNRLYHRDIKNAAVLVVKNQGRKVRCYVGSADFSNPEDAGQVDGVMAIRSPGSTLKPLLYAHAFDKGIITPKMVINDVPINYSGYEPENYDGSFNGRVTVEYALANSLNVPAVEILAGLKHRQFISLLKNAGFEQIRKDENILGLSVILGGCGVTLQELTTLYCTFANEGQFSSLSLSANNLNDSVASEKTLISKPAAFMLTEILTQLKRLDLPFQWQNTTHLPKVAWKTGTSYGRKDAWSIGYNKKYTVGVWVGNFSGEGVPGLSGASVAAPLLFEIFNSIDYNSPDEWYSAPDSLSFRFVCSETGMLPDTFCKNQVIDYYIPGVSPTKKCQHLVAVYVSPDSTISYCTSCLPKTGYKKAMYYNLPPEIIAYYDKNQIEYNKIPPHNPDCERLFHENAPQIVSPTANIEYYIDKIDSTEILLQCNAALDVEKVYWYINDKFYKSVEAKKRIFFSPAEGRLKISCTDDKGRNSNIWITVKYIQF